ncbi:MAG: UDP-2,3-diacylglucosamine diphosphatase LpxI [Alphaproteobacteria bacterium]|nr:UDP-2,3-diacylglucosamine diphosphatase LpxI [Alphaproteobacteria bacterium]
MSFDRLCLVLGTVGPLEKRVLRLLQKKFNLCVISCQNELKLEGQILIKSVLDIKKELNKLSKEGYEEVLFIGKFDRPSLLEIFRPRISTIRSIFYYITRSNRGDNNLFEAIECLLIKEGWKLRSVATLLPNLLGKRKLLTKRKSPSWINTNSLKDIEEWGRLDKGQSAILYKDGKIDYETRSGTDVLINDSKDGKDFVLVKINKRGQTDKFDLPALGLATLSNVKSRGGSGIIYIGDVLLEDSIGMAKYSDIHKLSLEGRDPSPRGIILASEASGDIVGGLFLNSLSKSTVGSSIDWSGIGGINMEKHNFKSLVSIDRLGIMGIAEVVKHLVLIRRTIDIAVDHIVKVSPSFVVSIDGPSLWRRVIRIAKAKGWNGRWIQIVSPQVWARRDVDGELSKYTQIDRLFSYFKFEADIFNDKGIEASSFGHYATEKVEDKKSEVLKRYPILKDKEILLLLPGSRKFEVKNMLLPMLESSKRWLDLSDHDNYIVVIPTLSSVMGETKKIYNKFIGKNKTLRGRLKIYSTDDKSTRYSLFRLSKLCVCSSGSVSSELALYGVPSVVVYKLNKLTYFIAKRKLSVKYISLVNILQNYKDKNSEPIFRELLQGEMTTENIYRNLIEIELNYKQEVLKLSCIEELLKESHKDGFKDLSRMFLNYIKNIR